MKIPVSRPFADPDPCARADDGDSSTMGSAWSRPAGIRRPGQPSRPETAAPRGNGAALAPRSAACSPDSSRIEATVPDGLSTRRVALATASPNAGSARPATCQRLPRTDPPCKDPANGPKRARSYLRSSTEPGKGKKDRYVPFPRDVQGSVRTSHRRAEEGRRQPPLRVVVEEALLRSRCCNRAVCVG